ncbi:kelch-like protein 40 [Drosophila tropicalis]|uniref:kelch-like protein 40 n=1 Tax=Drosophila tropicalis TaxID=46794 RepID=UPI0035AC2848
MDKWLAPEFRNLLANNKFSDCRIIVDNKSFECHKIILASASEFFERWFLKETESKDFPLEEVELEIFEKFLEYIYTYDAKKLRTYSLSTLKKLLEYADRFLVASITNECLSLFQEKVSSMLIGDLVSLFDLGQKLSKDRLIQIVINAIEENAQRFRLTANCYEVLELTVNAFEEYNKIVTNILPESERFKMIETYLFFHGVLDETPNGKEEHKNNANDVKSEDKHLQKLQVSEIVDSLREKEKETNYSSNEMDNENIRQLIQRLLATIDFSKMNVDDFYNIVGASGLLSYQQKFQYLYLTTSNGIAKCQCHTLKKFGFGSG